MQNPVQIRYTSSLNSLDGECLMYLNLKSIIPSSLIYSVLYLYVPKFMETAYSLKKKKHNSEILIDKISHIFLVKYIYQ